MHVRSFSKTAFVVVCAALASGCSGTVHDGLDAMSPTDAARDALADAALDTAPPRTDAAVDVSTVDVPAITAPLEQWTWIPVPGTQCADGSSTGIGVNLTTRSNEVLIFLEGGGACWDGTTCWGPVSTSFYIATGYGAAEFATDVQIPAMLPLRRADTTNPFRNMNFVYIPYCTGDVHAGNAVVTLNYLGIDHTTHFVGSLNLGLDLEYVAATFPSTSRIWLAGDSAGGFGAALNFGRVQDAFPHARVDVLDDSGQPIAPDPARWQAWQTAWNITFPTDCPTCRTDIGGFIDYYRMRYPTNRFGLISFTNDSVITTFMNLTPTVFNTELLALADHMDTTWPNGHYYYIPGLTHVGLLTPTPGLVTWLEQMVTDDPAWMSSRP